MKVFHISFHDGTIENVKNVMETLGHRIDSFKSKWPYYISKENADKIWQTNQSILKTYDILVFTDTTMLSRPVLQNLDKFDGIVIVYITNRFNWGIWGQQDTDYISTLVEASKNKRVRFSSDNRYDQWYASSFGVNFTLPDIVRLTPKIIKSSNIQHNDKLFIYDKGSSFDNYKDILDKNGIDYEVFSREKNKPFTDQRQIAQFKAFLHLPYQVNIQSLYENFGHSIVYVIPSKSFIKRLINECNWYYWEERTKDAETIEKSIDFSEWYQPENERLFIYFNDWSEINVKLTNDNIMEKKKIIENHMIRNNKYYIDRWRDLTNLDYR